jgi:hypothetical protein
VPLAFVAVTVKVYEVPADNPDTEMGLDALVPVIPPGDEVAVNVVTVEPPVAPAVKGTDAVDPLSVAVPIVGAWGTDDGVVDAEALEAAETPLALVAVTV